MKKIILFILIIASFHSLFAQETFTRKDSLQGGLRPERTCFDVQHYNLNLKINIDEKSISGYNEITFKVIENTSKIQVDLFDNLKIDSIIWNKKTLKYNRDYNAVFIDFPNQLPINTTQKIQFYYHGNPVIARKAPWDGGFVFSKDKDGKPWVAVACQGFGASCWIPCKDSQSDEPDNGVLSKIAVPNGLMNVSNGRFLGSEDLKNGYTRWDWQVKNPINSYDITLNIADYVHIHDNLNDLDLDYYVLRANEEKAKKHFEADVKPMLTCFQSKFGEYPFKDDGYKLVETPYLGMEHQSAVAYGNKYLKGYMGMDLSGTGNGMLFDFITIHESGHEWFGNSITSKDIADMWIHEGFTCYSESVFLECNYGIEKAQKYINGLKRNVLNDKSIIGNYGVNSEGSGDMYYKAALMLNTMRYVINNDEKWWEILLKYSNTLRHKIIDNQTLVDFFNKESGQELTPIFNQYLRYKNIPILVIEKNKRKLQFYWKTNETNFNMPIDVKINGKEMRIFPTNTPKKSKFKIKDLSEVEVLTNKFFVKVEKL